VGLGVENVHALQGKYQGLRQICEVLQLNKRKGIVLYCRKRGR
jgi:hypothetical protein